MNYVFFINVDQSIAESDYHLDLIYNSHHYEVTKANSKVNLNNNVYQLEINLNLNEPCHHIEMDLNQFTYGYIVLEK